MAETLRLYYSPGSCSRVSMIALEELELPYDAVPIVLARREQFSNGYLGVNPKGKVPTLTVDGIALTETVAILAYLARRHPRGGLLPDADTWSEARALSLLSWCASGLHPLVTRLRLPQKYCDLQGTADRIRELARIEMKVQLGIAEEILNRQEWILGDDWSIADAYLAWAWGRCPESGLEPTEFPALVRHHQQSMARPSSQKALRREAAA